MKAISQGMPYHCSTVRHFILLALACALPHASLQAGDSDVSHIFLSKDAIYQQSSATPTLKYYLYDISVDDTSDVSHLISSVSITTSPNSNTIIPLTFDDGEYYNDEASSRFSTISALNAVAPNGSYTFNLQTVNAPTLYSPTLSLSGDLYPTTPILAGGVWTNGHLQVADTTQQFQFTWLPFTNTAGVFSDINFELDDVTDDNTVLNLQLNATATSFAVDPNTMIPGHAYSVDFVFRNYTDISVDETSLIASYTSETSFDIQAAPEPGSGALIVLGLSAFATRRWRKTAPARSYDV